jgi:cytochrome oxidase Cu insertion factor (SCO1/SenC/PrrC family)
MRTLCATALCALLLATGPRYAALAHDLVRFSGVVLTVLPERREAVVRGDGAGQTTRLFRLAAGVDATALHPGDRIAAQVDPDASAPVIDAFSVLTRARSAPPAVRVVQPLVTGDRMPATRFVDQNGRAFSFADFAGTPVVLAFVYTRCRDPKECPLVSSNFHTLQRKLGSAPYHLVEMTLDPGYDRPAVLARYGALFDADTRTWTLGTGAPDTVLDFERRFGIDPFADPRVGLIHSERTVFIDRDGRIVDFIDQAGWDPDDIIARLRAMDAQPSNPLARLDFELSKFAVAVCGNRVAGFSGLADLAIVVVIFAGGAFFLLRLARKIFVEHA